MPTAVAINNINKRYRAKSELGKCLLAILDSSFPILDPQFPALLSPFLLILLARTNVGAAA